MLLLASLILNTPVKVTRRQGRVSDRVCAPLFAKHNDLKGAAFQKKDGLNIWGMVERFLYSC